MNFLEEAVTRARRALLAAPPTSQWVQVATLGPEGAARVRTVVLHEIGDDGTLSIATDDASEKVRALRQDPRAEVLLLSREHLEQWRFSVRFEIVDAKAPEQDERRALWKRMPPREKGYYVSPPAGRDRSSYPASAFHAEAHEPEPVERFVFLRGVPHAIDLLDVSRTPHDRFIYSGGADGPWSRRAVTP